jgi:hypothetical protein
MEFKGKMTRKLKEKHRDFFTRAVLKMNSEYLKKKKFNFSPFVSVQSPQEIEEKNSKKLFLGICSGPNNLFLDCI